MTTAKTCLNSQKGVTKGHVSSHAYIILHLAQETHIIFYNLIELTKSFNGGCTSNIVRQSALFESELKRFFIVWIQDQTQNCAPLNLFTIQAKI